jgi:hypothetical protein
MPDCESDRRRLVALSDDELSLARNARELGDRLAKFRALGCHVLALGGRSSALGAGFGVAFEDVWVDPDPAVKECYHDADVMKADQRAVSASSLARMAIGAGIVWLPAPAEIGTVPNLWRYRAQGGLLGYDGTPQTISGTAEVDLRDGSAQIGGWSPSKWRGLSMRNSRILKKSPTASIAVTIHGWDDKRVLLYRRHGLRVAETKAKNAAIRTLGLKSTYTVEELLRPFVVCRVIYLPDMTDARVREMVAANALKGAAILYMPTVATPLAVTQEADPVPTDPLLREDFPL